MDTIISESAEAGERSEKDFAVLRELLPRSVHVIANTQNQDSQYKNALRMKDFVKSQQQFNKLAMDEVNYREKFDSEIADPEQQEEEEEEEEEVEVECEKVEAKKNE